MYITEATTGGNGAFQHEMVAEYLRIHGYRVNKLQVNKDKDEGIARSTNLTKVCVVDLEMIVQTDVCYDSEYHNIGRIAEKAYQMSESVILITSNNCGSADSSTWCISSIIDKNE